MLFRSITGYHFPQNIEQELREIAPSLVNLSWTMQAYGLVIGVLDRHQSRYLDIHCYEDLDYEEYWSAVEQTLTESDTEFFI